jgi:hypothetical protein
MRLFRIALIVSWVLLMSATIALAQEEPSCGDVITSFQYELGNLTPIEPSTLAPAGITGFAATMRCINLKGGTIVDIQWLRNGNLETQGTMAANDSTAPGSWSGFANSVTNRDGLRSGNWEVQYRIDGRIVAVGQFQIVDTPMISSLHFGENVKLPGYQIMGERTVFNANATVIVAVYNYWNMPRNASIVAEWYWNGQFANNATLSAAGNGIAYSRFTNPNGLSNGTWELKLSLNGTLLASGIVTVGNTTAPPLPSTPSNQIQPPPTVTVNPGETINVRNGPGTSFSTVGSLMPGERVALLACSRDRDWYRIAFEGEEVAWVSASVVTVSVDPAIACADRTEGG